jgi:FkbM family methyltransferase
MGLKAWINSVVGVTGYKIVHRPSVTHDLRLGRFAWLQRRGIATVLDIGANAGQFASMIRKVLPGAMIYSFEPIESSFRKLQSTAAALAPIECFPLAMGDSDSVIEMHKNDFSASSSILEMHPTHAKAFPFTEHSVIEKVQVRSLDSMAASLRLQQKVLAKIDVQGYEMNVLRGAEKTIDLLDVLIIETSFETLYEKQPLFDDVYRFLCGRGFVYAGTLEQVVDPRSGAILQADGIFLRR